MRTFRFRWLLCLALLLPLAQLAAATHALRHLQQEEGAERSKPAPHTAPCELCVVAAALGSGGAAGTSQVPQLAADGEILPAAAPAARPDSAPALAYRSRAPPALSRPT